MNKILERLYNGDIYPAEEMGNHVSPEEHKYNRAIEQEREYFQKVLSPEGMEHFETLDSFQRDSTALYAFENFTAGFRLGAMLMMETLLPDNN